MARSSTEPSDASVARERWDAERRQGAALVEHGFEATWGWRGVAGGLRAARRASFLIETARLGPGVRCLELGAGTGEFTARLAGSGCELVALELSDATANVCRERLGRRAEVLVGNAETGSGLDGRVFDAMVGVSVLHHLDVAQFLERTMLPFLRPGGRFAFSEPNMANPQIWLERHVKPVKRWRHVTPHETAFRRRELRHLFETAGLRVERCEVFDFLHPATPARFAAAASRLGRLLERTPVRAIAGSVQVSGVRP